MSHRPHSPGLGRVALVAFALIVLPAHDVRSDDAKAGETTGALEGAWKQVEQKNGDALDYQKLPEGVEMINCITGGRFVWTITKDGRIVSAAAGKYLVDKEKYSEIIESVHGEGVPTSFVGSTFDFTGKVVGNTWHKVGTIKVNGQDYKIDEKWERCK